MSEQKSNEIFRDRLAELLNEDLSANIKPSSRMSSIPKCSRAPNTWTSPLSWKSTPSKSSIMP